MDVPARQLQLARVWFRLLGTVAPGLAARQVLRTFQTIRAHRRPGREEVWIRGARGLESEIASGRLAGHSWGEGAPVLLAHGWEGRGSQMGAFATRLAATGRRAIAYDAPGHGGSAGRRSSLLRFAEVAQHGVDAHGPLAGFVGHSFGVAGLCYGLWQEWIDPGQLGRLVFVAPPGDLHRFIRFFEQLLQLSDRVARGYEAGLGQMLGVPWDEARYCTREAACDTPLLIVHDDQDFETPIEEAEVLATTWPNARLLKTSGLGHRRVLRDPAVMEQAVDFLASGS